MEFVMKAEPDRDLYVFWSTVIDHWLGIADRNHMKNRLVKEMRGAQERCAVDPLFNPSVVIETDLLRADRYGSSHKRYGVWGSEFIYIRGGCELRRTDLGKYLDSILTSDRRLRQSLLSPRIEE